MKRFHVVLAIALVAAAGLGASSAYSCSEVFLESGGRVKVSARNFDFGDGTGFVRYNPSGARRSAGYAPAGTTPLSWRSRYASLTFDKVLDAKSAGDDLVSAGVDGINEAGLKIGTYFLTASELPTTGARTVVDVALLMQYLLDGFASVGDAVADLEAGRYRVVPTPFLSGGQNAEVLLHFFLHDAAGDSAIVEFLARKVVVTRKKDIPHPVLANHTYAESLDFLSQHEGYGGSRIIPGGWDFRPDTGQMVPERFVRGVYYLERLPSLSNSARAVDYGFATIQITSMAPFPTGPNSQQSTHWTIVTDIDNAEVHFRTLRNPTIATIDLRKLFFSRAARAGQLDLTRTDLAGDVTCRFYRRHCEE